MQPILFPVSNIPQFASLGFIHIRKRCNKGEGGKWEVSSHSILLQMFPPSHRPQCENSIPTLQAGTSPLGQTQT